MPQVVQNALANQSSPLNANLLIAASAITNGTWFPLMGIYPFSITVTGTFAATIKLRISNSVTQPADSDNAHPQLDSDIVNTTYAGVFTAPYKWVKCQVSAYTSGAPSCQIMIG